MAKAPVRKTVEQEDLPTPKQTTQPPLKAGGEQVIASKAKGIESIGNPNQWKILSQTDGGDTDQTFSVTLFLISVGIPF